VKRSPPHHPRPNLPHSPGRKHDGRSKQAVEDVAGVVVVAHDGIKALVGRQQFACVRANQSAAGDLHFQATPRSRLARHRERKSSRYSRCRLHRKTPQPAIRRERESIHRSNRCRSLLGCLFPQAVQEESRQCTVLPCHQFYHPGRNAQPHSTHHPFPPAFARCLAGVEQQVARLLTLAGYPLIDVMPVRDRVAAVAET
jgi:hypothetical protein